ncbi:MAG: Ig-like domain-containing protein [Myxococcota bacterium]
MPGADPMGRYLPGSSMLDGVAFADPLVSGGLLHWTSRFHVAAGASLELTFAVSYPTAAGVYEHRAWGEVSHPATDIACGDPTPSRIDTTPALDDFAPAIAEIGVDVLRLAGDHVAAAEGTPLTIDAATLLANDDGAAAASFALVADHSQGGAALAWDPVARSIAYTAPSGIVADAFSYRACSELDSGACATARVDIAVNRRPVLAPATLHASVGTEQVVLDLAQVYSDADGDSLGALSVDAVSGGRVVLEPTALAFVPFDRWQPARWNIAYSACDDGTPVACTHGSVLIVYNDPPVLAGQSLVLPFGASHLVPLRGYLRSLGLIVDDDPSDGDIDGLGPIVVTSGAAASCSLEANGDVIVTTGQLVGTDQCSILVCEELPSGDPGVCSTTRFDVRVAQCLADNDCAPTALCVGEQCVDRDVVDARDDSYVVMTGCALMVSNPVFGLMANDVVPQPARASVTLAASTRPDPTLVGTLYVYPDGTFTFRPVAGFLGPVTFDYLLDTELGGHDRATVHILVNGAPVARDDAVTTAEDTPVVASVLANDSDPNGEPLALTRIAAAPHFGHATIVDDGIRYAPDADWSGSDGLVYEACDPHGACAIAMLSITVVPVQDPPFAIDDWAVTPEDTAVLVNVLANDRAVAGASRDGEALALHVTRVMPGKAESATAGRPELQPDDTVLFTPGKDRTGPVFFGYEVCDSDGVCATAVARIEVLPRNDAPVALDDTFVVRPRVPTQLPVLANDIDPDGDAAHRRPGAGAASR